MSLGGQQQPSQFIPPDLQGFRGQQIGLLQALLGLPSTPQGGGGGGSPWAGLLGGAKRRGAAGDAGMAQGYAAGSGGLEGFFGPLGTPSNGLQRQATGGIEQFLNQPAPEQRALETSMPALQNILNGTPGQGVMDSLRPHFDRNLSAANQQGGRFGSGNAILRSRAVDDFNMLGAQAAERGQQTQLQAAQMLNLLSESAGNNPFNRMTGAFGIGQQNFQNADMETQRRLQLLMGLLGVGQGLAFNQPVQQGGGGGSPWAGLLGTLAGSFLGPIGAAAGGAIGGQMGGGKKP